MKKMFISIFYSTLLFFGATSLVAGDDIKAIGEDLVESAHRRKSSALDTLIS